MFEYTKSSVLDTYDFIKEMIYYANLVIQLFYIGYLSFRLYGQVGYHFSNIALLALTLVYFLYYILTKREFYTKENIESHKFIRKVIKNSKRIIHLYLIYLAVSELYLHPTDNDNMLLLITILMIFGFLFSIFLDMLLDNIEKRIEIIKDSIFYDFKRFKREKKTLGFVADKFLKGYDIHLDEIIKPMDDLGKVEAVKRVHHRQKNKAIRRRSFYRNVRRK